MSLRFYVGLHQPSNAQHFPHACISINRIRQRRGPFPVNRWILDSGAFTEVSTHGGYRHAVSDYAREARRWIGNGSLEAIVAQDWMCEPVILQKTGLTVAAHQRLTIERYDALLDEDVGVPVIPTLQGYDPADYLRHLDAYGTRLSPGQWVGVGSVCKRNGSPIDVLQVLSSIKTRRPDLALHGFGLKRSALLDPGIRALLASADSMAWSFHARMHGRNGNDWREAEAFCAAINASAARPKEPWQMPFLFEEA